MAMRIAIATSPEGTVFPGHFAHAPIYRIYLYEDGKLRLVEERRNPLGDVPDLDAGGGHHHQQMHGVAKYRWLRENVLPDVDVVLAGGACQTSYMYFTSNGVKMLFTEPVEVDVLTRYVEENPEEFQRALLESAQY
jgi:predicted Fe-Mo cluster-binding NifX family protein